MKHITAGLAWLIISMLAIIAMVIWFPGPASQGATIWQTCKPGTKQYVDAYRIYDNAWSGPSSRRFCVSSTGLNITIRSNAVAAGNVVAYPSIRFGAFYTDGDPQSGMPLRVTRIGPMRLLVSSRGSATGTWLTDADLWFRPRARWDQHGTFELVIANRWQGFGQPGGVPVRMTPWSAFFRGSGRGAPARIGHVLYRASEWITRDPLTGYTWPILVFRQVRQSATARLRLGAFVWWARRHGRLPSSWWLGSVAYGSELWSGGRGLTDAMRVSSPGLGS